MQGDLSLAIMTQASFCRLICAGAECLVLSFEYRLAPEHKFPAPHEDSYAELCWISDNAAVIGADPDCIAVGGDSSGGTMDEFFEGLTLIQTGKMKKKMPIILYGSEFWDKVMYLEALVEFGTISRKDLDLFQVVNSVDEAYEIIIAGLEEFAVDNPGPLL